MTAAIFGLVGVVIGAMVTGVVNWLVAKARDSTEARAAARILKSEMAAALDEVRSTLDEGSWPISYHPAWRESWSMYRRALAGSMEQHAFDDVATASPQMDQLQSGFEAGRADKDRGLSPKDRTFLEKTTPIVEVAKERLETFLGPPQ